MRHLLGFNFGWCLVRDMVLILCALFILAQVSLTNTRRGCAAEIGEVAYWTEGPVGEFQCVRTTQTHRRRL